MSLMGSLKIVEQHRPTLEELARGEAGPKIAEAAFYVHSVLGPGLDEALYRECFYEELKYQGIPVDRDVPFTVEFRGKPMAQAFHADFVIGDGALAFVIAEDKTDLHKLQIRSLLKLSGKDEAYLLNFRVPDMRHGITRAMVQKGNVLEQGRVSAAKKGA